MLDAIVTGKRATGAVALLAAVTVAWRAWPAAPVTRVAHETPHEVPHEGPIDQLNDELASYTVVPLTGEPVRMAVEEGRCVPFLRTITAMPNWQLRFSRGSSGCMGDFLDDSYEVHADGSIAWTRPTMPLRTLALTDDEMRIIRSIDTVSCVDQEPEHGYYVGWYRIGLSDDVMVPDGADIVLKSEMAARLDEVFDAARARYRNQVLGLGKVRAWFDGEFGDHRYHVELVDHQLRVLRHRKLLVDRTLDDEELVDLIDAARLGAAPAPDDQGAATGELHVAGHRYRMVVPYAGTGVLAAIDRAIDEAAYAEDSGR